MRKCILGSAILLSHMSMGITDETKSVEQQLCLTSPIAIQDYARSIAENVNRTVESILSLSPDEHTFENTLLVWNQLFDQLNRDKQYLKTLAESTSMFADAAAEALTDLTAYLKEVDQNYDFLRTMAISAEKFQQDPALSPFQQHMAARFLDEDELEVVALRGIAEVKVDETIDFTVLNLRSDHASNKSQQTLSLEILEENADIVCITNVNAEEARSLYDSLNKSYAVFIYVNRLPTFTLAENDTLDGLLIVSKYAIDSIESTQTFPGMIENDGCINFYIRSGSTELGRIYAVNLSNLHGDFGGATYSNEIVHNIFEDSKNEEQQIPFLLCGDVNILQQFSLVNYLLDGWFQSVSYPSKGIPSLALKNKPSPRLDVHIIPKAMTSVNSRAELKTAVRSNGYITNNTAIYASVNDVILCGHAEVSAGRDTKGNASVDMKTSTSGDTDYGSYEFEMKGSVKQDKDGDVYGEVKFSVELDW